MVGSFVSQGICFVNAARRRIRLQIDDARIEIHGVRRSDPRALISLEYELILTSPDPKEKLERLHETAFEWGAVL